MSRQVRAATLGLAACLVLPALSGCAASASARDATLSVSGATRLDPVVVSAPALQKPALDVTVGIASLQTQKLIAERRRAAQAAAARQRGPMVAGLLTEVRVHAGETVQKGQVIAVFDDRMQVLGVEAAQAAYRKALATADTMASTASDLRDQRGNVVDARATLVDQQALIKSGSAKLASQLGQMKAQLPQLEAASAGLAGKLGELQGQLAAAQEKAQSPNPPPGIKQKIYGLKLAIRGLKSKAAQLDSGLAKLKAAIPQLEAVLAKMATAGPAMAAAKSKIADALSQMSDGISQLDNASSVLRTASAAQAAGISMAKLAVSQATVRAPVAGVVLSVRPAGTTVMVGSPVAIVRPRAAVLVDTYLTSEQAARVKVGDAAEVSADSVAGVIKGRVSEIGSSVEFPPANYPTQIVHLANTVHVTISVPDSRLPVGTPVDVVIRPSG